MEAGLPGAQDGRHAGPKCLRKSEVL